MRIAPDDPAQLSPHQRLLELAELLAAGVRRVRARPRLDDGAAAAAGASRSDLASSALSGPDREQGECEQ